MSKAMAASLQAARRSVCSVGFRSSILAAATVGLSVSAAEAQSAPAPRDVAPVIITSTPEVSITTAAPALPAAPSAPPASVVAAPVPPPAPVVAPVALVPVSPAVTAPTAPSWSPVFTGSYFTRYELRDGFDDLGVSSATVRPRFQEGDALFYRVRIGIGTGLIDVGNELKVALQFTPQAAGVLGNTTTNPPNTTADAVLGLHEGYARVQGAHARVDAGRFELNYGDSLLIGSLDWNEVGRSFDGVRARVSSSPTSAWVDVFATLLDEGRRRGGLPDNAPGAGLGDTYFLGAYGAFGPAIKAGLELDAYALARSWSESASRAVPTNVMSPRFTRERAADATFGLRAKQKLKMFDYRFEGDVQAGSRQGAVPGAMVMPVPERVENVDVLAYQADLELGLSFSEGKFRVGLEGLYASGDDPTTKDKNEGFDELYPTAHKFLGLSDVFAQGGIKRTNVASGVLHLTSAATKSLTFQVDGHLFARIEDQGAPGPKQIGNGFAGGELDVGAVLVLAKGLKIRGTYAVFVPANTVYRDSIPTTAAAKNADAAHFAELELRYDLMP